ncbi:MAG: threonine synthase [Acidimicrobiia bacterium]
MTKNWTGLINAYRDRLPIEDDEEVVTLYEGNTPLVPLKYISNLVGAEVYAKVEGANPTGSFKDRGMTMAVTKAKSQGKKVLICASTGNTSAALAAYATRASLPSAVIIPEGKIALGKLAQAVMHGAKVIQIKGNFDQALEIVRKLGEDENVGVMNSINPYRVQGQKTAAFEICETLGRAPDEHFIPVGNAANIYAYWVGYSEYFNDGIVATKPKMRGVQADGSAPFVYGYPVENPETIATAIRIGAPASYELALGARDESGGSITSATDEKILEAYHLIASKDGVFVEPASAASIAGVIAAHDDGQIKPGSVIVCTVTGHGLKDPTTATSGIQIADAVEADFELIKRLLV